MYDKYKRKHISIFVCSEKATNFGIDLHYVRYNYLALNLCMGFCLYNFRYTSSIRTFWVK